jgi:hypothetical protein
MGFERREGRTPGADYASDAGTVRRGLPQA